MAFAISVSKHTAAGKGYMALITRIADDMGWNDNQRP